MDNCLSWNLLLLPLLLLASTPASADQLNLLLNGKAIHLDVPKGKHMNEKNWGWGLQYDYTMTERHWIPFVATSGFKDSNENMSYYAGGGALKRFDLGGGYHFDAGGIVFLMKRKGFHDGDPFLGALPAASVGTERISVNITFIPRVEPKALPLFFFQLKVAFGSKH